MARMALHSGEAITVDSSGQPSETELARLIAEANQIRCSVDDPALRGWRIGILDPESFRRTRVIVFAAIDSTGAVHSIEDLSADPNELEYVGVNHLSGGGFCVWGPGDGFHCSRRQLEELARQIAEALR